MVKNIYRFTGMTGMTGYRSEVIRKKWMQIFLFHNVDVITIEESGKIF